MDFSLPHVHEDSLATKSHIRHIDLPSREEGTTGTDDKNGNEQPEPTEDELLIQEANNAAASLFLGSWNNGTAEHLSAEDKRRLTNSASYPERSTPQTERITEDSLVVIFESFDNLTFCYPKKGKIFSNRNGHFHHEDFIGKPFGCKIRSRNNRGWGYVYLLKPTPELWSRSLNHRTQIVHFLDASMIVFYLNIRPNMVVCESGTGSGALSHCILRSIAPRGMLHTFEFNQQRAEEARREFASNGVSHISNVYHKDVCGKNKHKHGQGGFDRPQSSVDAIVLDLPEPWLAVPHAAYCIKKNARLVSYSPCIEQSQKTIEALEQNGFHSVKTMEFRLKENYVDEMEYDMPPTEKRQRVEDNRVYPREDKGIADGIAAKAAAATATATAVAASNGANDGETTKDETKAKDGDVEMTSEREESAANANANTSSSPSASAPASDADADRPTPPQGAETPAEESSKPATKTTTPVPVAGTKRKPSKKKLVARPFVIMRGHTAFLTFATAGNALRPKPE
mmetsp:Transcript_21897/g.51908  ORF Transcript_21897/g.51908 Transcript_21897/m.51908 type:complete len:513 (-) Transcript_21897:497-2035(-)